MDRKATIERIAPILTLTAGFLIAARQFLLERGVWLDEASLGLNIADRDAVGLLRPLDHGQAAPVLYLETLKAFTGLFGLSLKSLRLPSLIAYGASAWLLLDILKRTVRSTAARVLGCALFAFNYMLVYYSGEMKQYMFDVLATMLLLHLTLRWLSGEAKDANALALAGSLAFFFSNITVVVLAACFAMLATGRNPFGDREKMRTLLKLALVWGLSASAYYLLFVKDHPLRGFMDLYWTRAGGFPPKEMSDPGFITFIKNKLELLRNAKNIFHIGKVGWNEIMVTAPIALFVVDRLRRDRHLLWILLPVPLHMLLSWARLYPFEIRLTLYLLPLIILSMTMGLDALFTRIGRFGPNGPLTVLSVLAVGLWQGYVFWKNQMPIRGNEIKQAATSAMGRKGPGQSVWVYPNAVYHLSFYQRTGDLKGWGDAAFSKAQPDDVDACAKEVTALGSDVWLLFGHIPGNEDALIRAALRQQGYVAADSILAYKASAFLMRRPTE